MIARAFWMVWLVSCMAGEVIALTPDCRTIRWEYGTVEALGMFKVYVRKGGASYNFQAAPQMIVPAVPTMVTSLACDRLTLAAPGTYYLVVTAFALDGSSESVASNEVRLEVKGPGPIPPPPMPPPSSQPPPMVSLPPKPAPLVPPAPKPTPPVKPPAPPPSGGGLTSHGIWQGTCCSF